MYKRIDKRVARRYCTEGTHVVYAVPCKLNPDSPWVNGGDRISDYISDEYNTFDALTTSALMKLVNILHSILMKIKFSDFSGVRQSHF